MKKSLKINKSKEWGVYKTKPQKTVLINKFEIENDEVATQFLKYYCNKVCIFSVSSEKDLGCLEKKILKLLTNEDVLIPEMNSKKLLDLCINSLKYQMNQK